MKRDLNLLRQLLFDIESQGADCAPSTLHGGEIDERIRYHIRLLIDGGYVSEVDRTINGATCVRLTNTGHELIELIHDEVRWENAKVVAYEQASGESLTVIKAVLTKWAAEAAARTVYRDKYQPLRYRTAYRPYYHRVEPRYRPRVIEPRSTTPRYDDTRIVRSSIPRTTNEDLRLLRTRPDYLERFDWRSRTDRERYGNSLSTYETVATDPYYVGSEIDYARQYHGEVGISLPIHVV